jgi:hypothetical protein
MDAIIQSNPSELSEVDVEDEGEEKDEREYEYPE